MRRRASCVAQLCSANARARQCSVNRTATSPVLLDDLLDGAEKSATAVDRPGAGAVLGAPVLASARLDLRRERLGSATHGYWASSPLVPAIDAKIARLLAALQSGRYDDRAGQGLAGRRRVSGQLPWRPESESARGGTATLRRAAGPVTLNPRGRQIGPSNDISICAVIGCAPEGGADDNVCNHQIDRKLAGSWEILAKASLAGISREPAMQVSGEPEKAMTANAYSLSTAVETPPVLETAGGLRRRFGALPAWLTMSVGAARSLVLDSLPRSAR